MGFNKSTNNRPSLIAVFPLTWWCQHKSSLTFSVTEIIFKVSFDFLLLSRFFQKNHIWIFRLERNTSILRQTEDGWLDSPSVVEYWPSSADFCPDHQSCRLYVLAQERRWTSCPWWLSSLCPRCRPSRRNIHLLEVLYVQDSLWTGSIPTRSHYHSDHQIFYWSNKEILTLRFDFLRLLLSKLIGLKSFLSGDGEGRFLGVQVEGRSLNDPELSRSRAAMSSVLDHLAEIIISPLQFYLFYTRYITYIYILLLAIFEILKFIFQRRLCCVTSEMRDRKGTFPCWPFLFR